MYKTKTTFTISAAHCLKLSYESACEHLHGHNWKVAVYCQSTELNKDGMVLDFKTVKNLIHDKLDHTFINKEININPTAENLAKWICDKIGKVCYKVEVQETEGNVAIYERD